jgi:hypothetical protein
MQMRGGRCCKSQGLGQFLELATAAISAFAKGSGSGGGSAAPASPINVNPQISTQISPSISPVFQQQFQPSNSAQSGGTSAAPQFSAPAAPAYAADGTVIPQGAYPAQYPTQYPVQYPASAVPYPAGSYAAAPAPASSDPLAFLSTISPVWIIGGGVLAYLVLRR